MKRVVIFFFLITSLAVYSQNPTIRSEKDTFTGITWNKPYDYWPAFSGFYLYFGQDASNNPTELRIKIHFYGSDWIFFEEMSVLVNGKTFNFTFSRSHRNDDVNNGVYEAYDYAVSELPKCAEMLAEFDSAKQVQVRLSGKFKEDFALTYNQISLIQKYLTAYIKLGGDFTMQTQKPEVTVLNDPGKDSSGAVFGFIVVGAIVLLIGVGIPKWRKAKQQKALKYMEEMRALREAREAKQRESKADGEHEVDK